MPEYEMGGGFPMSDGTDAMPENVDALMNGGEPNQERMSLNDPSMDPSFNPNAEINPEVKAGEQAKPNGEVDGKAVDPAFTQVQQAFSKLTPEQRAQLTAAPVEIVHNGEKLSVPPDKQVPLMQMGLDYSAKMRALNVEKQAFEASKAQVSEHEKYYSAIDKAAKENPEWWQHVQASYQKFSGNRGTAQGNLDSSEMTPALRDALSKVTDLERKLDGFLEEKTKEATMKQTQAEDAELEQHIQSFAKENADFDWLTADASGLVLADRIVAHAAKNGINNFRAAARDYLFNDFIGRRELKAKEELKQSIQSKTKAGVVTPKAKPTGLKGPSNISKGYSDLFQEGYAELR